MTVALGTSMPTSTTLVETRMSASPRRKAAMISSFSLGFMRPCSSASLRSGKISACRRSCSAVAALASILSDSSTSGQMTKACRPSATFFSMKSYACWRRMPSTQRVLISRRPGGISSITDTSRSP